MTDYPRETEPGGKKGKILPSDHDNSPKGTDYPRETEPGEKKKGKVLPSDNNSSNMTDYPRETEPGKKKERFCLQITTAQIGLTTRERQNQVKKKGKVLPSVNHSPNRTDHPRETEPGEKKKERFCLQITTAHIRVITQERQN